MNYWSITDSNRANFNGKNFEDLISTFLIEKNINFQKEYLSTNIGIYNTKLRFDFYLPDLDIVIEAKFQNSPGTVDEKYPYLFENMKSINKKVLIVYGGGKARPGAINWLKNKCMEDDQIELFTFYEMCNYFELIL